MAKGRKRSHQYDVALSFAGENRRAARAIASRLKEKGFTVFYDEDHRARLWGTNQGEFEHIYGPGSRYVMPLVSEHYMKKDWTQLEFSIAKREAQRRSGPFILPVKLDDTLLLGFHDDQSYIDWRHASAKDVAEVFSEKYQASLFSVENRQVRLCSVKKATAILPVQSLEVLGLIVLAVFPLSRQHYQTLFPSFDWTKALRTLKRKGCIESTKGLIKVFGPSRRAILVDQTLVDQCNGLWVRALEKVCDHYDMAALLSLHHLRQNRLDDTVMVLTNVVEQSGPGSWNDLYLQTLGKLSDARITRRLAPNTRVHLYNALGLCHLQDRRYDAALHWFTKLRRLASRVGDAWAIGQSYINAGVASAENSHGIQAKRWYRKAIAHAESTNDAVLLGRSLGNLAQLLEEHDTEYSASLLERSLRVKRAAGDTIGLVAGLGALGTNAARLGRYADAIDWYKQAQALARRSNAGGELATIAHNLGNVYMELGHCGRAQRAYVKAAGVAQTSEEPDLECLALTGAARAAFGRNQFEEAKRFSRTLAETASAIGHETGVLHGLHGVGLANKLLNRAAEGDRYLNRALIVARRTDSTQWEVQCLVSKCMRADGGQFPSLDLARLRRYALHEERLGRVQVAAQLWSNLAREFHELPCRRIKSAANAYQAAIRCLVQITDMEDELIDLWIDLYRVHWVAHNYQAVLDALCKIEELAKLTRSTPVRVQAMNERGVCLIEMQRFEEADKFFRAALRFCRRIGTESLLHDVLHNTGESLRRQGKGQQAISYFEEAERIAVALGDHKGRIITRHSRALAILAAGNGKAADKLLQKCRDEARRLQLWEEHTLAWKGLGNVAWLNGRNRLAERRYARGLTEASRRRQRNVELEIAIDLARLRQSEGRWRQALSGLRKYRALVDSFDGVHLYHATLAELFEQAKQRDEAESHWKKGKVMAQKAGDEEGWVLCACGLARLYQATGRIAIARGTLRRALTRELTPAGRVGLLNQLLVALLESENEKEAQAVFDEASDLASTSSLVDLYIDLHMTVFDHEWQSDNGSREVALKAYVAALGKAAISDEESLSDVYSHLLTTVTTPSTAPSPAELASLKVKTSDWLTQQDTQVRAATIKMILWPLLVGEQLLPLVGDPLKLKEALLDMDVNKAIA